MLIDMHRPDLGATSHILWCTLLLACTGEVSAPVPSTAPTTSGETASTATTTSGATTVDSPQVPATTTATTGTTPTIEEGGEGAGEAVTGTSCATAGVDTAATPLRRLTRTEYQLTLQDLLALPAAPAVDAIAPDAAHNGFSTYAEVQTMSAVQLRSYLDVAKEQANLLIADAARKQQVLGCDASQTACLESFVTAFGERAYRRPLDATEAASIVSRARTAALDADDQIRFALEVILTSPSFLYRIEVGDSPEGLSNLTAREVASRLSFAAWGRAPSAELLAQADQGVLDTSEGLAQTASSMLGDARAQTFYQTFFREWLNFDEMRAPNDPPADWNASLMPAMQQETDRFLAEFAWGPSMDFLSALTANHSFVSPELSSFYGLPTPAADGRVEFPAGHPRQNTGLLGQASVLSAKSDGDSVALRGNWLRRTFVCEELYIDAAQLDAIGEDLVGLTRMQIIAERNTRPQCAACHSAIDPIGVGFEQFDATGRFDPTVDLTSYPVAPAFPDAADPSFTSIPELAQKLAALPGVAACLSSRVFLYAHGRDPAAPDSCAVEQATTQFIDSQHSFGSLLLGLINSPAFRLRRSPTL